MVSFFRPAAFMMTGFCIVLGVLQQNCGCSRYHLFAAILRGNVEPSPWSDEVVCPHLEAANGVVDIGSGAGMSLRCYENNTKITKLYVVEPTPTFHDDLRMNLKRFGLENKAELITTGGGALPSIPTDSVDTVVSVHLLCSVENEQLGPLLGEISRMMKPSGRYLSIDHTVAAAGSLEFYLQCLVAPVWGIVGNGCKFLDMPHLYRYTFQDYGLQAAVVEFKTQHIKLPLVSHHVKGVTQKSS